MPAELTTEIVEVADLVKTKSVEEVVKTAKEVDDLPVKMVIESLNLPVKVTGSMENIADPHVKVSVEEVVVMMAEVVMVIVNVKTESVQEADLPVIESLNLPVKMMDDPPVKVMLVNMEEVVVMVVTERVEVEEEPE